MGKKFTRTKGLETQKWIIMFKTIFVPTQMNLLKGCRKIVYMIQLNQDSTMIQLNQDSTSNKLGQLCEFFLMVIKKNEEIFINNKGFKKK